VIFPGRTGVDTPAVRHTHDAVPTQTARMGEEAKPPWGDPVGGFAVTAAQDYSTVAQDFAFTASATAPAA
jgi:hypothetical protein